MSGIKSTSGSTPPLPVDSAKGSATAQQQVAPVSPSSPPGGHSGPAIPQASSISQLTEGATIAAIVTARATGGDTMLHAEIGNFRMSTGSQLPVGSHIVLEIEAMDDVIIARLISLNGEKLASPPSVTLLPTVSALKNPLEIYGGTSILSASDIKSGLLSLNVALGNTSGKTLASEAGSPVATSQPASTLAGPSPSQRNAAHPKYGNTSVPIPTVGVEGSTPKSGQNLASGTAAYAHTNSPGPKFIPGVPTPGSGTTNADIKIGLLQLPPVSTLPAENPVLVKTIIQSPPLNQTIELPSGQKNAPPGSTLTLIISQADGKNAVQASTGTTATGTVIGISGIAKSPGTTPLSSVHVQTTAFGTVSYTTTTPPQVGSQLTLIARDELQQFPLSAAPILSSAFKTPHLPIMTEWGSLRDSLNILLAQDPTQTLSLLNARIPAPNSQLGASLLFFLSAMNGGSLDKWLGQDFRRSMEVAGHQNLLSRLDDDFASLARIHSDTGGSDWKNLTFPFYDGQALHQIKMYYRHRHNSAQDGDEDSTRFVIELDLSKSGPVQLDGLFNKARFDLVLRSQLPMDEEMRQHIFNIFNTNLEITGLHGKLDFKRTIPFPVHPTEEWENTRPDILDI